MSTVTVDSTHPSATVNLAVLQSFLGRCLEHTRANRPVRVAQDEYVLLNELLNATTTGVSAGNTVTSITITF